MPEPTYQKAAEHLAAHDAVLAPLIARYGPYTVRPHKDYYRQLVRSIIVQQLSIKVADVIYRRFCELFGGEFPAPGAILGKSIDELRAIGLSRAKAAYIRDLAQHVVGGKVQFDHLNDLSNDEIIQELTAVKGIGEWTAHMFLLFCMGRLDVLAHGDLGIKNGIRKLYGFDHLPSPQEVQDVAAKNNWHPYESVACWYIWRSLDNEPDAATK